MSTDYQDFQSLNEDATPNNSSGNNRWKKQGFTMNRGVLQPPLVICALSSLYAALLFIIIILVVTITNNGVIKTERSLNSQLGKLNASLNSKVEYLTQNDTTMMNKMTEIDRSVKRILSDEILGSLQSDVQRILNAVGRLREEIRNENSTQDPLCSLDWRYYALSCYYVSQKSIPWSDAKKDCEDKMSHLVVINNAEEQDYVSKLTQGITTWIGLTDVDGSWRWVDGTSYETTPKFWADTQPDDWYGHGFGGGEDCAHMKFGYVWNDDHCSRRFQYICEKKSL
ncbi:asialoglycoprotein receptor 1-like isoform X1 [Mixophyes fleayi]|uniref:asialoglycoprotein receptor 1-like isoform X1 n=1 Tax=Mixophyes fleayi TaxID=3061075 RepID=UPI003F4DD907